MVRNKNTTDASVCDIRLYVLMLWTLLCGEILNQTIYLPNYSIILLIETNSLSIYLSKAWCWYMKLSIYLSIVSSRFLWDYLSTYLWLHLASSGTIYLSNYSFILLLLGTYGKGVDKAQFLVHILFATLNFFPPPSIYFSVLSIHPWLSISSIKKKKKLGKEAHPSESKMRHHNDPKQQ